MKNLMNLKGAKLLSKVEQKSVNVEAVHWLYAYDSEVIEFCCTSCGRIQ